MREATINTAWAKQGALQSFRVILFVCVLLVGGILIWQAISASGNPNPLALRTSDPIAALDIGVLVFREGLECVLVLAALTAGAGEKRGSYRNPIAVGAAAGFAATLLTWVMAIRILDDLTRSASALALQAATGLLAVIVLLVVMNWFFHKLYWTGWISYHSKRKRELLMDRDDAAAQRSGFLWSMATLGFTSVYREGFEVVLFLQSYRLRLGTRPVFWGVCVGVLLSGLVAALTFAAHRKLPYRKMLIVTGILLGVVLIVMVGEQAQEMQLAHWIPTTEIPLLAHILPGWLGLWFSVSPTAETLMAQAIAAMLVLGSYVAANRRPRNRTAVAVEMNPVEIEQPR